MNKHPIPICENIIDNSQYDRNAHDYYFEISYDNNLKIDLVHIYQYYNEDNKIKHKRTYKRIDQIDMSLKEYCDFLIQFYESKLNMEELGTPRRKVYKRIKIRR